MQIMQQQHRQCNNNDYSTKCNVIMHVVPTEHQAPFAKVIIELVRLHPPSLKSFNLSGYNPFPLTMLCN